MDTLALVQASCKQAGFNVVDAGTPDFFDNGWPNGNFDVAMFAWAGSPLVTSPASTYTTGGGNNNGKYSNPQVDALIKQLNSEIDTTKQTDLIKQIETLLWTDLMSDPAVRVPRHPGQRSGGGGRRVQRDAVRPQLERLRLVAEAVAAPAGGRRGRVRRRLPRLPSRQQS